VIDCKVARRLIDDDIESPHLQGHLEQCAACRHESEFAETIASAVAALPRTCAPESLVDVVMAALASRPAATSAGRQRLLLRTWELGWITFACLALLCIVLSSLAVWLGVAPLQGLAAYLGGWADRLRGSTGSTMAHSVTGAWLELEKIGRIGMGRLGDWNGPWAMSLGGIAVFAVALALLLTHPRNGTLGSRTEDAHA
jgi:hypothetical protein